MFTTGTVRLSVDALAPGDEDDATIEPMSPEYWHHLRRGSTVPMLEGSRVLGEAVVIELDWPVGLGPEISVFVRAARELCAFVEDRPVPGLEARLRGARTKLLALYSAALVLPDRSPTRETDEPPAFDTQGWPGFEQHELYWEIFDPYVDAQHVAGSLSDDLLDVYLDVRRGLWHWDRHEHDEAVWSWRFSFETHWGDHAVDALRALHRACRLDTF